MPQLPSGKHLGLDPMPLLALIQAAESSADPEPLEGLALWYHADPWIDLVWLEPTGDSRSLLVADTLVPANSVSAHATGFRLDRLDDFLAVLGEEDVGAARAFVDGDRALFQRCAWLSLASAAARRLRHGSTGWDEFDLLAALLKLDKAYTSGFIPASTDTSFMGAAHACLEEWRPAIPEATLTEYLPSSVTGYARLLRQRQALPRGAARQAMVDAMLMLAWRMTHELPLEDLRPYEAEAVDIIGLAGHGYDPEARRHLYLNAGA